MAAPAHIASAQASNVSSSASIVIPSSGPGGSVTAGQRILVWLNLTPSDPSSGPTGMTAVADTFDEPTNSGGRSYLWKGVITSSGALDVGDTITVPLTGTARWAMGVVIAAAGSDVDAFAVFAPVPPGAGNSDGTVASPGVTAGDAARIYHAYGCNSQSNAAVPTWTPDGATTEVVDTSAASGSSKNGTLAIAHEATTGPGAVPARTATASVQVQPIAWTVSLTVAVDRPTATPAADITVAAGAGFTLGVVASGGSGTGYTYAWTQTAGTTTALTGATTTAPTGTAGTVTETLTYQVIVTDSASAASFAAVQHVTVIGASDTSVPVDDITTTNWSKQPSGADTFAELLADVDDGSYAKVTDPNGGQPLELGLSILNEPAVGDPVTLSVRCSIATGSSGPFDVVLNEGASTVIASWSRTVSAAGVVQQFDLTLTDPQIASVGDWDNLRIVIDPGTVT